MMRYLKVVSLIFSFVFLSYYFLSAEPQAGAAKAAEDEELPVQAGCECIRSINKLRKVERAARKYGIPMSKVYRIDKAYILSPETIAEALHCHCARQISTKAGPPAPSQARGSKLSSDGKKIALLTPGEVSKDCKVLFELNYEFTSPLKFGQAANVFRNLAAQINADAVVINSYDRNKGANSTYLQCDPKKVKELVFADLEFKRYDDYTFDPRTGLAWQRCSQGQRPEGLSCKARIQKSVFSAAQEYCPSLSPINGRQWRLPEVYELSTLVRKRGNGESQIDANFFPDTPPEVYWSITPYWNQVAAMTLDFESGRKVSYDKSKEGYVRCVLDLIPHKKSP